jgi:cell division protein FtsW (lipid II flippase)
MEADRLERRLLLLAGAFVAVYSVILSLSPAVRENSWQVNYRYSHWIGALVWALIWALAQSRLARRMPDHDPFLLPVAALLSGWGLLTVWRLDSTLGLRQAAWLVASVLGCGFVVMRLRGLKVLREYRNVLLAGGLLLTALTLLLGTSPTGLGPRLWLGCCGVYFQPSEPLKLLLVVYLTAYLADRVPPRARSFPMLVPTVLVMGTALALLLVQRDLGTASIFLVLYTAVLYQSTGMRRVLLITAAGLVLAAVAGFAFVDVVHTRLEAWINPWADASGRSYQIVQSLLSIANGGVFGRGPGLGSPSLVPVAHSDFIFSAIAEETGLVGTVGLLFLYAILLSRGFIIGLRSRHRFHQVLSAGISAYLGIQAILIVGGDLRLLPLTGVTLPFVSYGGSSLLTSFLATSLLLIVSTEQNENPQPAPSSSPRVLLPAVFGIGIASALLAQTWWAVVRGPDLLARTDNPRRSIADRYVTRGRLLDRNGEAISQTVGSSGSLVRSYVYPALAPVTGYTHPSFGQAGLEATLDPYLRGLQGNPASLITWNELLYGMPPPGLDVRLSIDLRLQAQADELLGRAKGAAVMLDAQSGEILMMASHPTYDPNLLDELGAVLTKDRDAPLLNRATLGSYAPGDAVGPLLRATRAASPSNDLVGLYERLGFYAAPLVRMPVSPAAADRNIGNARVSPLQMAMAAAALSNGGIRPAPRIALAVDTPQQGWVVLPALGTASAEFAAQAAEQTALQLANPNRAYWEWTSSAASNTETVSWYLGGTLPSWKGAPLTLVLLLESGDVAKTRQLGEAMLDAAVGP